MSDALSRFNSMVERFHQLQTWIERANAAADRFRPEIVARVVEGHTASRDELLVDLVPLMVEVEVEADAADARAADIEARIATEQTALEELELRQIIGDLDEDGWLEAATPLQDAIDSVKPALNAAREESASLRAALASWEAMGQSAGVLAA